MALKHSVGHQLRSRSPLLRAVTVVLVLIEVAGIVAIATSHRELGSTLIGLGVVALGPFIIWTRRADPRRDHSRA